MKEDLSIYSGSPYLPEPQKEKVNMSVVRSTLILSITLFISMSMYILFKFYEERYVFIAQKDGVFIFDRRNEKGSQCAEGRCQPLSFNFSPSRVELFPEGFGGPGIVVPKGVTVPYGGSTAPAEGSPPSSKKNASYYIVPGVSYNATDSKAPTLGEANLPPQMQPSIQMAARPVQPAQPAPSSVPFTPLPSTTVTPPTATVTPPPLPPTTVSSTESSQEESLPPPMGATNLLPPTGATMGG